MIRRQIERGMGLLLGVCFAGCPGNAGVTTGDAPAGKAAAPGQPPAPATTPATATTTTTRPATIAAKDRRAAVATLAAGGDADFNGDGVVDATTTIAGDTRTTIYFDTPGKPRLTIVTRGAAVDMHGDFNQDGVADFIHTGATVGAVRTQKSTWDVDFDGTVDETETMTFTGTFGADEPVKLVARAERKVYDPATGEITSKVSERDDLAIDAKGRAHPNYLVNFPTSEPPPPIDPAHPNIRIHSQSATPNGCNDEQQQQLEAALAEIEDNQIDCLASRNSTAAAAVRYAMGHRNIEIACAPSPPSASAWAASDVGPLLGDPETRPSYRVNIDPVTFSKSALQETLLHEVMHVAGYSHLDDDEADARTDRVNSCASYCSKCSKSGKPSETPGQDCARCSEPGKKDVCGVRKGKELSHDCHIEHLAACLGDHKVVDCVACLKYTVRHCDGTLVEQTKMPTCCARCPDGTQENLACTEVHGWVVNTCDDPPPGCE